MQLINDLFDALTLTRASVGARAPDQICGHFTMQKFPEMDPIRKRVALRDNVVHHVDGPPQKYTRVEAGTECLHRARISAKVFSALDRLTHSYAMCVHDSADHCSVATAACEIVRTLVRANDSHEDTTVVVIAACLVAYAMKIDDFEPIWDTAIVFLYNQLNSTRADLWNTKYKNILIQKVTFETVAMLSHTRIFKLIEDGTVAKAEWYTDTLRRSGHVLESHVYETVQGIHVLYQIAATTTTTTNIFEALREASSVGAGDDLAADYVARVFVLTSWLLLQTSPLHSLETSDFHTACHRRGAHILATCALDFATHCPHYLDDPDKGAERRLLDERLRLVRLALEE